jgi:hypothetical protein
MKQMHEPLASFFGYYPSHYEHKDSAISTEKKGA